MKVIDLFEAGFFCLLWSGILVSQRVIGTPVAIVISIAPPVFHA
jgi:hypothetical protein